MFTTVVKSSLNVLKQFRKMLHRIILEIRIKKNLIQRFTEALQFRCFCAKLELNKLNIAKTCAILMPLQGKLSHIFITAQDMSLCFVLQVSPRLYNLSLR